MNHDFHPIAYGTVLLFVAIIGLSACGTTESTHRSEEAANMLETVEQDIERTIAQIDSVEASLNRLRRTGQTDIVEVYEEYSARVAELEERGQQLIANTDAMVEESAEYFAEWEDASYSNIEVREISERRRAELRRLYDEIARANEGVEEALTEYMENVQDIRTFLEQDLSPNGVEAISPLVPDFIEDGRTLKQELRRVQSAVNRANNEMTRAEDTREQQ